MSYTSGLLSYPYPSLLTDDLSTPLGFYESSLPYRFLSNNSTNVSLNQDLSYKPIGGYQSYRTTNYASLSSPLATYRSPHWSVLHSNQNSFSSLNDFSEYSESLATASNTASSVARSIINGPSLLTTTYQQPNRTVFEQTFLGSLWEDKRDHLNLNEPTAETHILPNTQNSKIHPIEHIRSPTRTIKPADTKVLQNNEVFHSVQSNHIESHPPHTKDPFNTSQLPGSPGHEHNKIPKQHQLDRNQTITDLPNPMETVEAWLSGSQLKNDKDNDDDDDKVVKKNEKLSQKNRDDTPKNDNNQVKHVNKGKIIDGKIGSEETNQNPEHVWSIKTDQLHTIHANREKNKSKSLNRQPVLPPQKTSTNQVVKSNSTNNTARENDVAFNMRNDSYFDSLFDGVFYRKNSLLNRSKLAQPTSNSYNKITVPKNVVKQTTQKQPRTEKYEPPSSKRINHALNTTSSWRKQLRSLGTLLPNSVLPFYMQNELTHRDFINKDEDERYREALQAIRAEKKREQGQVNETAVKRMSYGNYVRNSTKDALLYNAVTPRKWGDFMDVKKGNVYELSKEEKKQLYQQSKSYGERIRNRNFAIHYAEEASRLYPSTSRPSLQINNNEIQENNAESEIQRPQQTNSRASHPDTVSRTSIRPSSASTTKTIRTNKTFTFDKNLRSKSKQKQVKSNRSSQTSYSRNQSSDRSTMRPSDEEDEDMSDYDNSKRLSRRDLYTQSSKRNTYENSSNRSQAKSTTASEEEEDDRDTHTQNEDSDESRPLFTMRNKSEYSFLLPTWKLPAVATTSFYSKPYIPISSEPQWPTWNSTPYNSSYVPSTTYIPNTPARTRYYPPSIYRSKTYSTYQSLPAARKDQMMEADGLNLTISLQPKNEYQMSSVTPTIKMTNLPPPPPAHHRQNGHHQYNNNNNNDNNNRPFDMNNMNSTTTVKPKHVQIFESGYTTGRDTSNSNGVYPYARRENGFEMDTPRTPRKHNDNKYPYPKQQHEELDDKNIHDRQNLNIHEYLYGLSVPDPGSYVNAFKNQQRRRETEKSGRKSVLSEYKNFEKNRGFGPVFGDNDVQTHEEKVDTEKKKKYYSKDVREKNFVKLVEQRNNQYATNQHLKSKISTPKAQHVRQYADKIKKPRKLKSLSLTYNNDVDVSKNYPFILIDNSHNSNCYDFSYYNECYLNHFSFDSLHRWYKCELCLAELNALDHLLSVHQQMNWYSTPVHTHFQHIDFDSNEFLKRRSSSHIEIPRLYLPSWNTCRRSDTSFARTTFDMKVGPEIQIPTIHDTASTIESKNSTKDFMIPLSKLDVEKEGYFERTRLVKKQPNDKRLKKRHHETANTNSSTSLNGKVSGKFQLSENNIKPNEKSRIDRIVRQQLNKAKASHSRKSHIVTTVRITETKPVTITKHQQDRETTPLTTRLQRLKNNLRLISIKNDDPDILNDDNTTKQRLQNIIAGKSTDARCQQRNNTAMTMTTQFTTSSTEKKDSTSNLERPLTALEHQTRTETTAIVKKTVHKITRIRDPITARLIVIEE
ncbi:unnamed protein product [Didymodactylos carnosus]|uniref:Uncharacterized protein n=1 Tax=Didymodactylos carnosus TaxID=1234261 RepID=A0A813Z6H0_9BILA|nr:unnamed protein product [Didymodactylos carnosus]CAF0894510.1 unnamed protein product [Didymodactylos carnosus]CAF3520894.1 unnamed protein product [Didymodactylos carnosus]CAF3678123.1 unnamed protein product [Didymodactylos carnosus]